MTEIETGEGKIYLATVIDTFSRHCPGYASPLPRHRTERPHLPLGGAGVVVVLAGQTCGLPLALSEPAL